MAQQIAEEKEEKEDDASEDPWVDFLRYDLSQVTEPDKPAIEKPAVEIELQRIDHVSGEVNKEILVCFLDMFKDQHAVPRNGRVWR